MSDVSDMSEQQQLEEAVHLSLLEGQFEREYLEAMRQSRESARLQKRQEAEAQDYERPKRRTEDQNELVAAAAERRMPFNGFARRVSSSSMANGGFSISCGTTATSEKLLSNSAEATARSSASWGFLAEGKAPVSPGAARAAARAANVAQVKSGDCVTIEVEPQRAQSRSGGLIDLCDTAVPRDRTDTHREYKGTQLRDVTKQL